MKHETLQLLQQHDILIPHFITVNHPEDYSPTKSFLLDSDKRYAVRSSFGDEDSNTSSFAGQFDTELNVEKKEIPAAIQRVFNSVNNRNVSDYVDARNLDKCTKGCVIIQEMVDAEISGVIFTANPLGLLNETVVTIGRGLGCNVVEDKTNTTSYFYNNDDDIYYYEQQDGAPTIDDHLLHRILLVAKQIKKILGYDVDVEFAVKNNHVFVLQARPITTLDNSNPIILDNSNIVESYPGISLPLTQDFVKTIYHDIFHNLILRMSKDKRLVEGMDEKLQYMTDVANWRIYYRISNWYSVLNLLPFSKKIIPMWQEMLGVSNTSIQFTRHVRVSWGTKIKVLFSFLHYINEAPRYMDELNVNFDQKFENYQKRIDEVTSTDDLLDVFNDIKWDILADWDITLINDLYAFINTALAGKRNRQLISDIKNLESMKPVASMNNLILIAQSQGMGSEAYQIAAQDHIQKFGDRCLAELKLETETYRSNPELLHSYIGNHMSDEIVELKDQHIYDKSITNVFVRRARVGIENREVSRLNRSKIFGLSRSIFLKIGRNLVSSGQIETERDVFYLHMDELDKSIDYKEIVLARKAEKTNFESVPAYSRLVFANKAFDKKNTMTHVSVLNKQSELHGIASSMGKISGEALVIDEPNDKIDTTGKILVTRSTDPGWVFLIQNAIGIIAEKGSLLSHTAIISRELHKPAVVNVKDCTRLIRTGDLVELNAYDGVIRILERKS